MANVYVDSQLRSGTKENCQLEVYGSTGNTREIEVRLLQRYCLYHRLIVPARGFWSDGAHCARVIVQTNSQEDVWQRHQSRQEQ